MPDQIFSVLGYIALSAIGVAVFIWGLLLSTHSGFQQWDYHRTENRWPDINSNEYKIALANIRMIGARAGLMGGLLVLFTLAQLGLLP